MSGLFRKSLETYKGRLIGCAPGTHAAISHLLAQHLLSGRRGAVLDIGTGFGALLLRLQDDLGFCDLTGADLDPEVFDVPGADFRLVELNRPFAQHFEKRFHLITATDVIEHLDSPRLFLTEIRSMIEDNGLIAISLPNVASWQGRIKFLLKGELWGFGERNYRAQRHISPITRQQMVMMMREVGFKVIYAGSAGSFSTTAMKVLTSPMWVLTSLLNGTSALGECAVFIAQKASPDADLKMPTDYAKRWNTTPEQISS